MFDVRPNVPVAPASLELLSVMLDNCRDHLVHLCDGFEVPRVFQNLRNLVEDLFSMGHHPSPSSLERRSKTAKDPTRPELPQAPVAETPNANQCDAD